MLIWTLAILALLIFWAGITVHELGHAFACRKAGVAVTEISVAGFPLPRVPALRLPIKSRYFPETRWVLQPLLLGAYMQPDEAQMKALPRQERIRVLAMGPIASCVYGFAFLALAAFTNAIESAFFACETCAASDDDTWQTAPLLISLGIGALVLGGLFLLLRGRFGFHIVLLGIGILLLPIFGYVIYSIIGELVEWAKPLHEIFPGPFALTRMAHDHLAAMMDQAGNVVLRAIASVSVWAGAASVLIGLFNMVPCFAGDGTMIVMEYLPEPIARWVWRITLGLMAVFITFAVVGDIAFLASLFRTTPA